MDKESIAFLKWLHDQISDKIREEEKQTPQNVVVAKVAAAGNFPSGNTPNFFPDDLGELVDVTDEGTFYKVRAKRFLSKGIFADLAEIVKKQLGGSYVSAGKDSHFEIPKKV